MVHAAYFVVIASAMRKMVNFANNFRENVCSLQVRRSLYQKTIRGINCASGRMCMMLFSSWSKMGTLWKRVAFVKIWEQEVNFVRIILCEHVWVYATWMQCHWRLIGNGCCRDLMSIRHPSDNQFRTAIHVFDNKVRLAVLITNNKVQFYFENVFVIHRLTIILTMYL